MTNCIKAPCNFKTISASAGESNIRLRSHRMLGAVVKRDRAADSWFRTAVDKVIGGKSWGLSGQGEGLILVEFRVFQGLLGGEKVRFLDLCTRWERSRC